MHITSEFHDQKYDMYTDGENWKSGEAVRAAAEKDGQSKTPGQPSITDLPRQWDLGDNTLGENPDVHLGDTRDRRTFGEKMTGTQAFGETLGEDDDPAESKVGRAIDMMVEHGDDFHDALGNEAESVSDILARGPEPTGTHTLHSGHPGYDAAPSQGLNVSDAVGGSVLMAAAAVTGLRLIVNRHRRDH